MKKLMFAAAVVVAMAMSTQAAATIKWGTGTNVKAPTSATSGAFSTVNAGSSTLSLYVYVFDAQQSLSSGADIYNAWVNGGKTFSGTVDDGSHTGKGGTAGASWTTGTLKYSSEASTPYYAYMICLYDDEANDIHGYMATQASTTINTAGSGINYTTMAKDVGSWTMVSVPEPTSGLLLLVGGALLGLRRRRA